MSCEFTGEKFEGDWPAQFGVLSAVYFSHPTRTDFADDTIAGQRSSGG